MGSDWSVFALVSVFFLATTVQCVITWRGGNGALLRSKGSDTDYLTSGTVHQLGKTVLAGPVVFGALALLLLTHHLLNVSHTTVIRDALYVIYCIWWAVIAVAIFGSYVVSRRGRPRFLIPPQYRDQ